MNIENRWILAVIVLTLGVILGEIASRVVRGTMSRTDRSTETREMARPLGLFVFWAGTAVGMLLAASFAARSSLNAIADSVLASLPRFIVAVLVLLAGYALSIGVSAGIAQSSLRASGVRHRGLERASRYVVLAVATALALTQLGIDTTVLSVAMGIIVGVPALTIGAMTAFGARPVATEIAAGRAVRSHLRIGHYLVCAETEGTIVAVHPVSVEVDTIDGRPVQVPFHCLIDHPYSIQPARSTDDPARSDPPGACGTRRR